MDLNATKIQLLPDDVINLIIKEYRAQLQMRIQKRLKKGMHVSLLKVMVELKRIVDDFIFDSAALLTDDTGVQTLGVVDIVKGMVDTRFDQPKRVDIVEGMVDTRFEELLGAVLQSCSQPPKFNFLVWYFSVQYFCFQSRSPGLYFFLV